MFVVVGLGNPGEQYAATRHNVGFMAVDEVNRRHGGSFKKGKGAYFISKISLSGNPVLLVKPTTYMNLSGQAVRHVVDYFQVDDFTRLLIVLDDFHLPFGKIRVRPSGSAAGQKGLLSIFQHLGTQTIPRVRIGIGSEFERATDFVLSPFSRQEQKDLPGVIDRAADAVQAFVLEGVDKTMSVYNGSD